MPNFGVCAYERMRRIVASRLTVTLSFQGSGWPYPRKTYELVRHYEAPLDFWSSATEPLGMDIKSLPRW